MRGARLCRAHASAERRFSMNEMRIVAGNQFGAFGIRIEPEYRFLI
jgi:hypothetical protein